MHSDSIPVVLVISATDPTGGAGMATDIRVCQRDGVYPLCCVTAVTVQNQHGVTAVAPSDPDLVRRQLEAAFEAVVPDAVKIGLLPDAGIVKAVAEVLRKFNQKNVVLDPVLAPTCGGNFLTDRTATMRAMSEHLFGLTELVTPNIPEYESFLDISVDGKPAWSQARNILLKGGHGDAGSDFCTDILYKNGKETVKFKSRKLQSPNLHGTGCFLSTAIAAGLARIPSLELAINHAKAELSAEIEHSSHDSMIPEYGPVFTPEQNYKLSTYSLL